MQQASRNGSPRQSRVAAPMRELKYVLRAYDKDGKFDETNPQPLWLVLDDGTTHRCDRRKTAPGQPPKELLAGYGAERADGSQHPAGQRHGQGSRRQHSRRSTASGSRASRVPVDPHGNFLAEEILPAGMHTVEVAVLDEEGNGAMFLRDLEFEKNDWFYVGIADVTASDTQRAGPPICCRARTRPLTTTRRSMAAWRST